LSRTSLDQILYYLRAPIPLLPAGIPLGKLQCLVPGIFPQARAFCYPRGEGSGVEVDGKARQAATLVRCADLVAALGAALVGVGLVPHLPHRTVAPNIGHTMKCNRKPRDAEAGPPLGAAVFLCDLARG
jgi:hypothetical protein